MTKKVYSDQYFTYNSKYISNVLALRTPQHESLEIFARIVDTISLKKNNLTIEQIIEKYKTEIDALSTHEQKEKKIRGIASEKANEFYKNDFLAVKNMCPTLSSFERNFPSICFALATGIGKTRLMGACIAYLHYQKGIKHFFVMAPNLTIYNKLKSDLTDTTSSKYVFKGLDKFVNSPVVIDGDTYGSFQEVNIMVDDVVINIFNISKLNSDSSASGGSQARIKRLNEVLGKSYFSYLQSLDDLCIFMDESHHYHADKSFDVINELRPILGVEFTATPQVQKGTRKVNFKNVVYEYSLAHALNDGQYVKVPVVFTKKDFRPEEFSDEQLDCEKLNDGIRIHEATKNHLEVYARAYKKRVIKPFVLVVAKDTNHSKNIMEYIKSDDFFNGYYKDKVIEINSAQSGVEKDENITRLLALENANNKIEIVIHVNMLKEGWDVTNLYTIVPLRASASETLTEQTIGRGLRLPYGDRTGDEEVDRLSIVSHDKYAAIVELANDPNSLVRKVYCIDDTITTSAEKLVTVELPTVYDTKTLDETHTSNLIDLYMSKTKTYQNGKLKTLEHANEVVKFITGKSSQAVMELNKQVKTIEETRDESARKLVENKVIDDTIKQFPSLNLSSADLLPAVKNAIETCVQILTEKVIPIPQAVVRPFVTVKQGFENFNLDTKSMNWHPSDDILVGTELIEKGKTFDYTTIAKVRNIVNTPENEIVQHIIEHDDIDYNSNSELLYSLVNEAKVHFMKYLSREEAEKVMRDRQKTIADIIYAQMREHFYMDDKTFKITEMRPFSRIEPSFGGKIKIDKIYDLQHDSVSANEVKSKVFNGFKKACHTLYKFDSETEKTFAIVLENDKNVLKWLRPSPLQFNIYYGQGGAHRYEPDFIVETKNAIYMVETKAKKDIENKDVIEKAKAASAYCSAASEWNAQHGGKPWSYVLIPHDEITINSSFGNLVINENKNLQLNLQI